MLNAIRFRCMDATHLDELIELEDSYWWHAAKRRLVVDLLAAHAPPPGLVVEGGIGSARNLLEFQSLGYEVAGLDLMPEAVAHARQRGLDNVHEHDLTEVWPITEYSARAVVLLDVIEHVPDPVATLRHARRALAEGGTLFVTVPAYPWLYSHWDKLLGHYRRYTTAMLREHAESAGFHPVFLSHWNSFTLPAACAVRTYERIFPAGEKAEFPRVSPLANRVLQRLASAERWWLRRTGVPAGLSLVGVFQ